MADEKYIDLECRVRTLEINDAKMGEKIENLIQTMTALMSWIKALVIAILPALGFLFYQVFRK